MYSNHLSLQKTIYDTITNIHVMSNFCVQNFSCNSYVQVDDLGTSNPHPPTYSIKLLCENDVANVRLVEGDERLSTVKI